MCTASGTWLGDKDIEKALAAWDKLPPVERKPGAVQVEDRGPFDPSKSVTPPPGGLIIREFYRELQQDGKGVLFAPRKRSELQSGGRRYEILEEPNRDFLWLTEAEWKSLVPEAPKEGDTFPLPVSVRDRLLRFHLVDAAKGLVGPWERDQIRKGELSLTVTEVSPEKIGLRLEGAALLADKSDPAAAATVLDARLLGRLDYDRKARRLTRFDLVAVGSYRGMRVECEGVTGAKQVQTTLAFAFELVPADSWDRSVPPRGTRLVSGSSASLADYFRGATGNVRPRRGE
jgi:hypothetical protein